MKVFHFIDMVRKSKLEDKFSVAGPTACNMPFCHQCKMPVEAAMLEHGNDHSIEIQVRCHGKQDACRIEFPYRLRSGWEESDEAGWAVKRAMADYVAFESSHTEK